MERATATATAPSRGGAPLAYFWGDDAYGLEAAVEALRKDPGRFPGGEPDRWRPEADGRDPGRLLGEIRERLATGSMWGGGSLAIVSGAGAMVRNSAGKEAFAAILATVAPGNGLAIVEETESGMKEPPSKGQAPPEPRSRQFEVPEGVRTATTLPVRQ
jgi:hypothetical protein